MTRILMKHLSSSVCVCVCVCVCVYRFLVQEWCNSTLGQALRSWLLHKKATREPLIDLLLELLLDCAQGINYLHDKNIIHGGKGHTMCACVSIGLTEHADSAVSGTRPPVSGSKVRTGRVCVCVCWCVCWCVCEPSYADMAR